MLTFVPTACFVAEPLNQRIAVLDRFTGLEVAQVPAPPGGFLLAFSIRVRRPGRLVVLDSGGFPNPEVPSIARVYDYDYKPLVVASDQGYRLAAINAALTADMTQPPWIVTKILFFGQY